MWRQKEMFPYFLYYVKLRTMTFLHVQFSCWFGQRQGCRGMRKSTAIPGGICPFPLPTGLFGRISFLRALLKQPHGYSPPKYDTSNCREGKFSCSNTSAFSTILIGSCLVARDRGVKLQRTGLSSQ